MDRLADRGRRGILEPQPRSADRPQDAQGARTAAAGPGQSGGQPLSREPRTSSCLLPQGEISVEAPGSYAKVVRPDLAAGKSVVHIVDDVLLPVPPLDTAAWLWFLTREAMRADKSLRFPAFNRVSAGGDAMAAWMAEQRRAAAAGGHA